MASGWRDSGIELQIEKTITPRKIDGELFYFYIFVMDTKGVVSFETTPFVSFRFVF